MNTLEYLPDQGGWYYGLENDLWKLSDFGGPVENPILEFELGKMFVVPRVINRAFVGFASLMREFLVNDRCYDRVISLVNNEISFSLFLG